MNFSRCFATAVSFLILGAAARANLFVVDISTRTYSLNGHGEVTLRAGNQRQIIDLAAENSGISAKSLVVAYDTDADAIEVVRRDDGTLVTTVMTFTNGIKAENAGKTRAYRQTFLTLSGSSIISGTAVVSGTTDINGSVAGPVRISYDHAANILAYRWDGDFQYSIPGDSNTLNRVVHGRFTLGREIHAKDTP